MAINLRSFFRMYSMKNEMLFYIMKPCLLFNQQAGLFLCERQIWSAKWTFHTFFTRHHCAVLQTFLKTEKNNLFVRIYTRAPNRLLNQQQWQQVMIMQSYKTVPENGKKVPFSVTPHEGFLWFQLWHKWHRNAQNDAGSFVQSDKVSETDYYFCAIL